MKAVVVTFTVLDLLFVAFAAKTCRVHYGKFRDCLCGVQYRDVETRCCSKMMCAIPHVRTENLTCPLTCQNNGRKILDTSTNIACKCSGNYGGACCEKVVGSCDEVLLNWKGEIKSPSQADYPGSKKCIWTIRTDPIRRIALSARSFNVYISKYCWHDYVIVNNGAKTYRVCGHYFPTIYSTANIMLLEFHYKLKGGSFHLDYQTYYKDQKCGPKRTYNELNGVITSPQHPLNYGSLTVCTWSINVWSGHRLVLVFRNMNIQETRWCVSDYVFVIKTDRTGRHSLVRKLCGTRHQIVLSVTDAAQVRIRFVSDRKTEGKGFELHYYSKQLGS